MRFGYIIFGCLLSLSTPSLGMDKPVESKDKDIASNLEEEVKAAPLDSKKKNQEEVIDYNIILNKVKKLPPNIQKALIHGLDLNIMVLNIFAKNGRDKAYLFDENKPQLPKFFFQNLRTVLQELSECPDSDFKASSILND